MGGPGPGFGGPAFGPGFGGPGIVIGVGGGNWGGYWGRGYYSPYYYSSPGYYYTTPSYYYSTPSYQYVTPATYVDNREWGMQITQVFDGTAKKANLRSGDIIVRVSDTRVQSFESLQTALAGNREVEISYIDGATKKTETKRVRVDDNKIGVEVKPVPIS